MSDREGNLTGSAETLDVSCAYNGFGRLVDFLVEEKDVEIERRDSGTQARNHHLLVECYL